SILLPVALRNGLALFFSLRHDLQVRQAVVERLAELIVEVQKHTDDLELEITLAAQGPGDERLAVLGAEGEFRGAGILEGFDENELDLDSFVQLAFGDGHVPLAELVAFPIEVRADAGIGA